MDALAVKLTEKFIAEEIISSDKKETYITGLKLILSDIINFSLILIAGILTGTFIYSCIYLIVLCTVRKFSGGFHAKTYWLCRTVTVGTYILTVLACKIINDYCTTITPICDTIAVITMIIFAPIRHPNKELTDKEVKANKLLAVFTTVFYTIISIALAIFNCKEGLFISLTLFAVTTLMYEGLITNGKKRGKNNGKNQ